jgi:hypothetical protein
VSNRVLTFNSYNLLSTTMAEISITSLFPHAVLTELANTRPTQHTLKTLQIEVNANAASVPSNRGNGTLGHLALVVSPATYAIASNNIPFNPPVNPGPTPDHPAAATSIIITEINRQFLADLQEFRTYTNTETAIKKLIIAAVPPTFINQVRDEMLGFSNISVLTILNHLHQTYGKLTTDDLDLNTENLHREWSPDHPLEDLFEQVRQCQAFAAETDPISDPTAVRAIIHNLEKSGLFTDAIRDWRKRTDADKTLQNLRIDFTQADRERQRQLTTTTAGYHHAAVALAATNAPRANNTLYYCWSHGYGPNSDHTSTTCKFPAPGHRPDSTVQNMLGGCNYIHRQRNEVGIYIRPTRKLKETANAVIPAPTPKA